jgi:hypothetical protein
MDDSFLEASLEPVHSSGRTAEGQLTSLANQTCYWLGLQPSVLWSPGKLRTKLSYSKIYICCSNIRRYSRILRESGGTCFEREATRKQ